VGKEGIGLKDKSQVAFLDWQIYFPVAVKVDSVVNIYFSAIRLRDSGYAFQQRGLSGPRRPKKHHKFVFHFKIDIKRKNVPLSLRFTAFSFIIAFFELYFDPQAYTSNLYLKPIPQTYASNLYLDYTSNFSRSINFPVREMDSRDKITRMKTSNWASSLLPA